MSGPSPRPKLRILLGEATALGPGKASLLEALESEGSISAAARSLGMSYRRAWLLIDTMNASFRAPLVATTAGGRGGGGAGLTALGREALARYRAMEQHAQDALRDDLAAFRQLLRDGHRDETD